MGLWMVERFTLAGVTFQNWIIPAMMIIAVGALIAGWRERRKDQHDRATKDLHLWLVEDGFGAQAKTNSKETNPSVKRRRGGSRNRRRAYLGPHSGS